MRLLLADDHTLFRDALAQYIERAEPDSTIALAKDYTQAMEILKVEPVHDLVLLDMQMPGMNGLKGLEKMKVAYPDLPVALMSGVAEKSHVEEAMRLGAIAYFPKTLSGRALLKAIQLVLTGEKFIPVDSTTNVIMPSYYGAKVEQVTNATSAQMVFGDGTGPLALTRREREVLSYLAKGSSNKEIANTLGLQVVTVKLHVRGLCRKLDVKNRTQAALRARELGLAS